MSHEMSPAMSHDTTLRNLRATLDALQQRRMPADEFCRVWRNESDLLAALPPRYAQVLDDLLARLEAGSLFGEESCSFSQEDLRASLSVWLDKAGQTLAA